MRKRLVCNYAVIRFLPYVETGEFANVGVVVYCPETRFFGYRMETTKVSRVTEFFPELAAQFYRKTLRLFQEHLEDFKRAIGSRDPLQIDWGVDHESGKLLFLEFIRPRESVMRFGEPCTLFADDPNEVLASLFSKYVERQFAQAQEYQEQMMTNNLRSLFRKKHIVGYHPARIGDSHFKLPVPFARTRVAADPAKPKRAIRPVNLGFTDPTRAIERSSLWRVRLEQLHRAKAFPEAFLLVVRIPTTAGYAYDTVAEATKAFQEMGCIVLPPGEREKIAAFASQS